MAKTKHNNNKKDENKIQQKRKTPTRHSPFITISMTLGVMDWDETKQLFLNRYDTDNWI